MGHRDGHGEGRKGRTASGDKLYQFIDDMVACGAAILVKDANIPEAQARELSMRIAHQMCFQYARTNLYVPASLDLKTSERDKEIWREYTSDSPTARRFTIARVKELSAKYSLTDVHIYNIVRIFRQREIDAHQGTFVGFEKPKEN